MRISDLISLGFEWLIYGTVLALVCCLAFWISYRFIYQKMFKGTEHLTTPLFLLYTMFFCYIIVVLGVTLLNRPAYSTEIFRLTPFYSYKEAWNQYRDADWRNIILNIFMLVPFGFLLPYIAGVFKKIGWTTLAGLIFTLFIEITQLLLKRGIFETDDLMNNTLGVLIGYGLYQLADYITKRIKKTPIHLKTVLPYQIPLLFTVLVFTTIFVLHDVKELGNLKCHHIIKAHPQSVICNASFDENDDVAFVYIVPTVSIEETREFAENYFTKFDSGIDESRTDIYDETIFYWNDNPDCSVCLMIDYEGNKIDFTNYEASFSDPSVLPNENATEEEVRQSIEALGFYIPKEASFVNKGNGKYYFDADCVMAGDYVYNGNVSCTITEEGIIKHLDYNIIKCTPYKEFPIISEKEAYEKIAAGIFRFEPAYEPQNIIVNNIFLAYEVDSKGFYQPIYILECRIDGQDTRLYTPALY